MATANVADEPLDSSDEDGSCTGEETWIFYRARPEWRDVQPVSLDEGCYPVVAIAYSERCQYWRNLVFCQLPQA